MSFTTEGIRVMWWEFIPFTSSIDTAMGLLANKLPAHEKAGLLNPAGPMCNTVRMLSAFCVQQPNVTFEEVQNEAKALEFFNASHTFVFPVTLPKSGSMLYRIPGVTFLPFMESPGLYFYLFILRRSAPI